MKKFFILYIFFCSLLFAQTADQLQIRINEVDVVQSDNPNTNEFIELVAPVGTSLNNIIIVLHRGEDGSTYGTWNFIPLNTFNFPNSAYGTTGKSFFILGPTTLSGFISQPYNYLYTVWNDGRLQNATANQGDGILVAYSLDATFSLDDIIIDKIAYVGGGSGDDGGVLTAEQFKSIYGQTGSKYIVRDGNSTATGRGSDNLTAATSLSFDYTSIYVNDLIPTPGTINIGQSALPVELSLFTGKTIGDNVILNWQTETEVNNYGFEVLRQAHTSTPLSLTKWEKIGFVNGNGNSNSPKNYSFIDENPSGFSRFQYRLKQIDNDGQFDYSNIIEVNIGLPSKFELSQNFPNPFNPSTTISFSVPEAGNVKLTLYNLLGQHIRTLLNEYRESGSYSLKFNAADLNSGIYLYKIEANGFTQTRKMTLVK